MQRGKHSFQVVFVDLRQRPHKVELMWGFPHPDFTWRGVAPELRISGPGVPKQSVPEGWLCHSPENAVYSRRAPALFGDRRN
jgi:hypothetical protein